MPLPPPLRSPLLHLLLLLLGGGGGVRSYEAPQDREDVFARRACPAFLSFSNAAHLEGSTLELACLCKPPQVREVVWFYRKHHAGPETTRALSDLHGNRLPDPDDDDDDADVAPRGLALDLGRRFSIRLFSLRLQGAGPGDSGLYLCGSAHRDFFYGYDLDVQEALRLSPRFGEWGRCDRCGPPGEQVRAGLCYVRSAHLSVRYRAAERGVASCGSGAVPRAFGLSGCGGLEVRACHVTCPPQAPPTSSTPSVIDLLGISSWSRPAGVLPVFYLSRPANQDLTLRCPGSRPQHAVAWDRGSEPIYRSARLAPPDRTSARLAPPDRTSARLAPPDRTSAAGGARLDAGGHLVFSPARPEDSGVYYCWLQGRRAAEMRLLVYAHFGRGHAASRPDVQSALRTLLTSYAAMATVFTLLVLARAALGMCRSTEH